MTPTYRRPPFCHRARTVAVDMADMYNSACAGSRCSLAVPVAPPPSDPTARLMRCSESAPDVVPWVDPQPLPSGTWGVK